MRNIDGENEFLGGPLSSVEVKSVKKKLFFGKRDGSLISQKTRPGVLIFLVKHHLAQKRLSAVHHPTDEYIGQQEIWDSVYFRYAISFV